MRDAALGHLAVCCRIGSVGRLPADRHGPRGGPHIADRVEMTRSNIPLSFQVSLRELSRRRGPEGATTRLAADRLFAARARGEWARQE
jgi:hypothetical protein